MTFLYKNGFIINNITVKIILFCFVFTFNIANASNDKKQFFIKDSVNYNSSSYIDNFSSVKSIKIKKIKIFGLERTSEIAIRSIIGVEDGQIVSSNITNQILKEIYNTNQYVDVVVKFKKNNDLEIRVIEGFLIKSVNFEGNEEIDSSSFESDFEVKEGDVLNKGSVSNAVQKIIDVYKVDGFFGVSVDTQIIKRENKEIDLIFKIDEGNVSTVKNIEFIGNDFYSDDELRAIMGTKEDFWYSSLAGTNVYRELIHSYDKEILRRFYANNGFLNFKFINSNIEMSHDKKDFMITAFVEEGDRYRIKSIKNPIITNIKNDKYYNKEDIELELHKIIDDKISVGDWYSIARINDLVTDLNKTMVEYGLPFLQLSPNSKIEKKIKKGKVYNVRSVNVEFKFFNAPKIFIERIDIKGNSRTSDDVIRRAMDIVEGDAYNDVFLKSSQKSMQALGFFSSVTIDVNDGKDNFKKRILVEVEEKATGKLSFSGGYSSQSGTLFNIAFEENNFLGRGYKFFIKAETSEEDLFFDLAFSDPYFLNENISVSANLFRNDYDRSSTSLYKKLETGIDLSMGYKISKKWKQNISIGYVEDDIYYVSEEASDILKDDLGMNRSLSIGTSVKYANLNDVLNPNDGYSIGFSVKKNGLFNEEESFSTGGVNSSYYNTFFNEYTFYTRAKFSKIFDYDNINQSELFHIRESNVRGFAQAGPVDINNGAAIGGLNFGKVSLNLDFPLGIPKDYGLKGSIFVDSGILYGLSDDYDTENFLDDKKPRVSSGFSLKWSSPIGPLNFNFINIINSYEYDETLKFQFTFGNNF